MSVERFAVQQQARRRVGFSILHRCPCGGIVCCNGLFGGTFGRGFLDAHHRRRHFSAIQVHMISGWSRNAGLAPDQAA